MHQVCQGVPESDGVRAPVLVVAGAAGSGKTTLGRELAKHLGAAMLDLDTLTNPLLDRLDSLVDGPHWNGAGPHSDAIREGRYAALRSVARDLVAVGQRPVLVAPFTRELAAGPEWEELVQDVAPAAVVVVHVDGSPELLASRRAARKAARDEHRPIDAPSSPVLVPHIRVDAESSTRSQVEQIVRELGLS